ncbi:hypothetical protein DVH05_006844 [Phytophthora capsici]|nr:hypothetical protein DVH05_006844 [Phytophthora capsici]
MESRRKRVEQKGRFTITEIIPGSPYSPRLSSSSFQDDEVSVADFPATDDAPTSNGSCSEVATIQPQSVLPQQIKAVDVSSPAATAAVNTVLKAEEPPETSTQPPETVLVPPTPIESSLIIAPDAEASVVEAVCEVSTPTAASAAAISGSPSRKYSSPKKSRDGLQRARRVKRRGRFTIIELASDSPTSRKNADDLYDHRFVTTTSIGGASVESVPEQLSRNFDGLERRAKPKRSTRSMPRLRQTSLMRRSRRRSESPTREFIESVDMVDPSGSQVQQQEAAAYAKLQALPTVESVGPLPNGLATVTDDTLTTTPNQAVASLAIPDSSDASTATISPTSVRPMTPSSQLMKLSETNGSVVNLPQSSITITTAQFLQQQQTIASLIRQQHDLKQIIRVLQEQQQQLMIIPSQINELKRQREGFSDETRDKEMRELYLKADKLTQANESLHSLINAAEREARHRTLEIECLSEENDELRHRCAQLESRYMDERKQCFVLEEELQRLRMLSLTQREQQLRQQQEQTQSLSIPQPSAAV